MGLDKAVLLSVRGANFPKDLAVTVVLALPKSPVMARSTALLELQVDIMDALEAKIAKVAREEEIGVAVGRAARPGGNGDGKKKEEEGEGRASAGNG